MAVSPIPVVDYWTNFFTPEMLNRLYVEPPEFNKVVKWWGMEDRLAGYTPEAFIAMMDSVGLTRVGVPATKVMEYFDRHLIWDVPEADVAALVARFPDRLFGMAGINPLKRLEGLRALERSVRDHGFKAAILHVHGFGLPLNHAWLYPFYAKCAELGVPIVLLAGQAAESMPAELGRPTLLDDVALCFPELKIVAVGGYPWVEELIAMSWKHPNLFIGTSQYSPKYWHPELVKFINTRGRGKVLFGTGFPVLTHAEAVAQVLDLDLRPEARKLLLHGAAEQVFGL